MMYLIILLLLPFTNSILIRSPTRTQSNSLNLDYYDTLDTYEKWLNMDKSRVPKDYLIENKKSIKIDGIIDNENANKTLRLLIDNINLNVIDFKIRTIFINTNGTTGNGGFNIDGNSIKDIYFCFEKSNISVLWNQTKIVDSTTNNLYCEYIMTQYYYSNDASNVIIGILSSIAFCAVLSYCVSRQKKPKVKTINPIFNSRGRFFYV